MPSNAITSHNTNVPYANNVSQESVETDPKIKRHHVKLIASEFQRHVKLVSTNGTRFSRHNLNELKNDIDKKQQHLSWMFTQDLSKEKPKTNLKRTIGTAAALVGGTASTIPTFAVAALIGAGCGAVKVGSIPYKGVVKSAKGAAKCAGFKNDEAVSPSESPIEAVAGAINYTCYTLLDVPRVVAGKGSVSRIFYSGFEWFSPAYRKLCFNALSTHEIADKTLKDMRYRLDQIRQCESSLSSIQRPDLRPNDPELINYERDAEILIFRQLAKNFSSKNPD